MDNKINENRRNALKYGLLGAGLTAATQALGQSREMCGLTPAQTSGPFYPVKDQPDKDTDLTTVRGQTGTARGDVIFIQGIVTDQNCNPVPGALVEIWQACITGKYNHPNDPNPAPLDPNFQYWGRAVTDNSGRYLFKTIIPGAYPADTGWTRPPHVHYKVQKIGYTELTTQLYFEGHTLNKQDRILMALPESERKKVVIPIIPSPTPQGTVRLAQFNLSIQKINAVR